MKVVFATLERTCLIRLKSSESFSIDYARRFVLGFEMDIEFEETSRMCWEERSWEHPEVRMKENMSRSFWSIEATCM